MILHATEWLETENAPAMIVTVDATVVAANSRFARLVGVPLSALPGVSVSSYIAESSKHLADFLRLSSRGREPIPGSFTFLCTSGDKHEIAVEGCLLRPRQSEEPALVLLVCHAKEEVSKQFVLLNDRITALSREIRARVQTEIERDELIAKERAAREQAERISRTKDEFLATLSHELRTPLNAILGWTQILKSTSQPSPQDLEKGLDVIERNTRIQTQLIDDLLDMSRIISGKMRLNVQRVELASVLEAAIQSTLPAFEAKGVRIQNVLDSVGGIVMGDPNRLQQVFWNLLSNAAKFTPKGGRVQVLLERANSHIEVTISDTGCGIKPDFLPYVFDRFQQADSSITRPFGGLGLGLAIVRHLVELHGGTVRAKSGGDGKGAAFIVSLPVTVFHDHSYHSAESVSKSSRVEPECPPGMAGLKVLVVDDEADSLGMVARVLGLCGCDVVTANSAAEGFDAILRHRPAVIISDIGMPGEDGYAFLQKVRSLPPDVGGRIPAIALTAYARSEDRRRAILSGFQMHLAKPIESSELIAVVASVAGLTFGK